jgi:hypothetical protein
MDNNLHGSAVRRSNRLWLDVGSLIEDPVDDDATRSGNLKELMERIMLFGSTRDDTTATQIKV